MTVACDDPFGSMDGFRRNHTVNQIYRCGQNCTQVIVFSHDPNFLHLLWERVVPADRKSLSLTRIGEDNTTIAEWDIERGRHATLQTLACSNASSQTGKEIPVTLLKKSGRSWRPIAEIFIQRSLATK